LRVTNQSEPRVPVNQVLAQSIDVLPGVQEAPPAVEVQKEGMPSSREPEIKREGEGAGRNQEGKRERVRGPRPGVRVATGGT